MKKGKVFYLITALILSSLLIIQQSCKKDDELPEESPYLSVTLHRLTIKHDLYYQLKHNERSIEMEFSLPIDTGTVAGNISFSDKSGSLSSHYDLVISGRRVLIAFHSDFHLSDGWKYLLTITTGLKSTSGESLKQNETIELRTSTNLTSVGSTQRNSIACIIEDFWAATQVKNAVPVPIECCLQAIWNGHSDLFIAAKTEYMKQPPAPTAYKVVAFGHTHEPMLKVYPPGKQYTSIYANSGSWINADDCNHAVRTYLIINPAEWTGSDLDVVMLYQYNLNSNSGNPDPPYEPVLLSEESIDIN